MDLAVELARYGPAAKAEVASRDEARAYCRRLAQSHYENFTVVSRLFPRRLYQHLCNVYAYCRWADDLADERVEGTQPLALLDLSSTKISATFGRSLLTGTSIYTGSACSIGVAP